MTVVAWSEVKSTHMGDRTESRYLGVLLCDHCSHTQRRGESGPRDTSAVWVWYHKIGNVSHLCDDCFAGFSKFAAEDADMAPAKYHRVKVAA